MLFGLLSSYKRPITNTLCGTTKARASLGIDNLGQYKMMDPAFQPGGSSIVTIQCAAAGKHPFYIHEGEINNWVCNNGGEKKVTAVILHVLSSTPYPGLVLDVGSNFGYYGLLAMKMGFESLLFDLQPECHQRINNAIVVNQFQALGRVVPFGVSNIEASFRVPSTGCNGRFPASAHEQNKFNHGDSVAHVYPLSKFIDDDQHVLLMKVDTEGNERNVLEGAMPYFSRRLVSNAIVEVTPGSDFWKHVNITREQVAETFSRIANYGYTMISLHDWSIHDTPAEVHSYIMNADFGQSDVWLTDHAVNASEMLGIKALV